MCGLWASVEWDKSMKYSCSLAQSSCQILPKKRLHHLSVAQIRIQSVPVVSRRGEASLWEVETGNRIYHIYHTIAYLLSSGKGLHRSLKGPNCKMDSTPHHVCRVTIYGSMGHLFISFICCWLDLFPLWPYLHPDLLPLLSRIILLLPIVFTTHKRPGQGWECAWCLHCAGLGKCNHGSGHLQLQRLLSQPSSLTRAHGG